MTVNSEENLDVATTTTAVSMDKKDELREDLVIKRHFKQGLKIYDVLN